MNSFHDQLTEHLIKDKELSFVQGICSDNCLVQLKWPAPDKALEITVIKNLEKYKDENDEEIDEEDHDEVFDKTQPTKIKRDPQETSSRTQIELKIQDFARDWARTLKQSEYKTEIFRGLT